MRTKQFALGTARGLLRATVLRKEPIKRVDLLDAVVRDGPDVIHGDEMLRVAVSNGLQGCQFALECGGIGNRFRDLVVRHAARPVGNEADFASRRLADEYLAFSPLQLEEHDVLEDVPRIPCVVQAGDPADAQVNDMV